MNDDSQKPMLRFLTILTPASILGIQGYTILFNNISSPSGRSSRGDYPVHSRNHQPVSQPAFFATNSSSLAIGGLVFLADCSGKIRITTHDLMGAARCHLKA